VTGEPLQVLTLLRCQQIADPQQQTAPYCYPTAWSGQPLGPDSITEPSLTPTRLQSSTDRRANRPGMFPNERPHGAPVAAVTYSGEAGELRLGRGGGDGDFP
jgi:hypothetical protein